MVFLKHRISSPASSGTTSTSSTTFRSEEPPSKRQRTFCVHDANGANHESPHDTASLLLGGLEEWWAESHLNNFLSYAMEQHDMLRYGGNPITSCQIFRQERTAYIQLRCPNEAKSLLQLGSVEANGVMLRIIPWKGSPQWPREEEKSARGREAEKDHRQHNDDDEDGYYREYVSGRKVLMWSRDCEDWSPTKLARELDQELRRYDSDAAIVGAYQDSSKRWIIDVASTYLASKLRDYLWYSRHWWVYGLEEEQQQPKEEEEVSRSNHRLYSFDRHDSRNRDTHRDDSNRHFEEEDYCSPHQARRTSRSSRLASPEPSEAPETEDWVKGDWSKPPPNVNEYYNAKYCDEFISGTKIVVWKKGCNKWTRRWLLDDLNQDMKRYGTSRAVLNVTQCVQRNATRWVLQVANAELAKKLRSKLRYSRNWWVYGFGQDGEIQPSDYACAFDETSQPSYHAPNMSQEEQEPLTGLAISERQDTSPTTDTPNTKPILYIRPKPTCPPTKAWLVGYLNAQLRRLGYRDKDDAIVDALKLPNCWAAEMANDVALSKLHEMLLDYPGWWVSTTKPRITESPTKATNQQPISSTNHIITNRPILYIRPKPTCDPTKSWLIGDLNAKLKQDAILDATKLEHCWAAKMANDSALQRLNEMLQDLAGWLVSSSGPIDISMIEQSEKAQARTPTNKSQEPLSNSPAPATCVMVFQRPPTSNTTADDLLSFVNDYISNGAILSATRQHGDALETCWILQASDKDARDRLIEMQDVKFQDTTLSFHKYMRLSFMNNDKSNNSIPKDVSRLENSSPFTTESQRSETEVPMDIHSTSNANATKQRPVEDGSDSSRSCLSPNDVSLLTTTNENDDNTPTNTPPPATPSMAAITPSPEKNGASLQMKEQIQAAHEMEKQRMQADHDEEKQKLQAAHDLEKEKLEREMNRLKAALFKVTSQYRAATEKAKESDAENDKLTTKLADSQESVEEHKAAAESATKELEQAKAEAAKSADLVKQKQAEALKLIQAEIDAKETATTELERTKEELATVAKKLETTQGQLHAVHESWQDQYTELSDAKVAIEKLSSDLEQERVARQDTYNRYCGVAESLALQANELAEERRARLTLQEYILHKR